MRERETHKSERETQEGDQRERERETHTRETRERHERETREREGDYVHCKRASPYFFGTILFSVIAVHV